MGSSFWYRLGTRRATILNWIRSRIGLPIRWEGYRHSSSGMTYTSHKAGEWDGPDPDFQVGEGEE